jgi:predicted nucleic acid-binding protein
MKESWLIDTDILIDYLRGHKNAVKFLDDQLSSSLCYLSTITIAELYVGVKDGNERKVIEQFINEFLIVDIDYEIALNGGLFRRDWGKSHGVGLADGIIAATAEKLKAKLATLNIKHYPMFQDILAPYNK